MDHAVGLGENLAYSEYQKCFEYFFNKRTYGLLIVKFHAAFKLFILDILMLIMVKGKRIGLMDIVIALNLIRGYLCELTIRTYKPKDHLTKS